jgi:hypothetical protein
MRSIHTLLFTLVFPIAAVDAPKERIRQREKLVSLSESIRDVELFEFAIRCAVLSNDAFGAYTHVFLVPDEGHSKIIKLHDRLYTGAIESELRLDIPFIPHIGIGNSLDPHSCKQLVVRLNADRFEIRGRVERLDLIWSDKGCVNSQCPRSPAHAL